MSYILPVQFDQYTQYQNRVDRKTKKAVTAVQMNKVRKAYLLPLDFSAPKQTTSYYKKQTKQQNKPADKVYADITGIGRLFNVCV